MSESTDGKGDLLEKWFKKRQERKIAQQNDENEKKDEIPLENYSGDAPVSEGRSVPPPILSGKLAEFLAKKTPRHIHGPCDDMTSHPASFEVHDLDTRLAIALSLVLTSHITRFASTSFSESALCKVRDKLLHTLSAHDAVRVEVEAYDLLNWFAGAMNDAWSMTTSVSTNYDDAQCTQNHISMIERAIAEKRDLEMRYYTGTRGEFSTRRITPVELSAEKYMIAYCHVRKENRLFRLSRILSLSWIDTPSQAARLDAIPGVSPEKDESFPVDSRRDISQCAMYAEDEDDLRAITAEGSENESISSSPQLPLSLDPDDESLAVVLQSGVWVPESQLNNINRTPQSDLPQRTLPGMALPEVPKSDSPKKSKPKRNTTGFLPGFE